MKSHCAIAPIYGSGVTCLVVCLFLCPLLATTRATRENVGMIRIALSHDNERLSRALKVAFYVFGRFGTKARDSVDNLNVLIFE